MAKSIRRSNKSKKLKKSRRYKKSRKNITYKLYGGTNEGDINTISPEIQKKLFEDLAHAITALNEPQNQVLHLNKLISTNRYSCRSGLFKNKYCELIKAFMYLMLVRCMSGETYIKSIHIKKNETYGTYFFKKFESHISYCSELISQYRKLKENIKKEELQQNFNNGRNDHFIEETIEELKKGYGYIKDGPNQLETNLKNLVQYVLKIMENDRYKNLKNVLPDFVPDYDYDNNHDNPF